MRAEGERCEAPHHSCLCGGSRRGGTQDFPGGEWMEGPPKGTGTPRGRRAAVLSRRGMDGGTEGRSGAFPVKDPQRAERGAALSRWSMDGETSKGHKDPKRGGYRLALRRCSPRCHPRALSAHLRGRHCRHCSARTGTFQTRRSRGRRQRPLAGAARGSCRRAALGSGTRSGSRPSPHGPGAATAAAPG